MDIGSLQVNSAATAQLQAQFQAEQAQAEGFEDVLQTALENGDDAELMEACQAFESYFVNLLFQQMRTSVTLTEKSQAEQTYQEMLDEQIATQAAEQGSFGLANFMYQQMTNAYAAQTL